MSKGKFTYDHSFIKKSLAWAKEQGHFIYTTNNNITYPYNGFKNYLAIGIHQRIVGNRLDLLDKINEVKSTKQFITGILSYDLFQDIHHIKSQHSSETHHPNIDFFIPQILIHFDNEECNIDTTHYTKSPNEVFKLIDNFNISIENSVFNQYQTEDKSQYIKNVNLLKQHIQRGDIYEINYCINNEVIFSTIDLISIFDELNTVSPMPFASLYYSKERAIICASPERFLKKENKKLISQPIKGTAKRLSSPIEDEQIKIALSTSEKEKSENVMIVDLVRNDLSIIANDGSVIVEELCKVYTFKTIHQLISTVTANIEFNLPFKKIIAALFPMGSMTGAPKHKALKLIDEFESQNRGYFSGSIGYLEPNGDFDFNVIIRSLIVDFSTQKAFFPTGSAITIYCDAAKEYDECKIKAAVIKTLLNQ